MKHKVHQHFREITKFVKGSPAGLIQLLVSAARKSTYNRIISCPTYPVPVRGSGLADAVRHLREVMDQKDVHVPTLLGQLYGSVRTLEQRKRRGQFFTSEDVATWALSIASPTSTDDVCDPGCGTAVFAHAVIWNKQIPHSYTGVENDPILALCAAHVLESINAPDSFRIWYSNFLLLEEETFTKHAVALPTFIISNPPYIRFHNLAGRENLRIALSSEYGVLPSAFSGAGNYFLLKAAQLASSSKDSNGERQSSRKGRLLFFFPQEAEGAAHMRQLRRDLERTHGWVSHQHSIPRSQTGIDLHPSNATALVFVFEKRSRKTEDDQLLRKTTPKVADIIQIRRGISTGSNGFFVLSDEEVGQRRIPKHRLRRVLPTRIPVPKNQISREHWDSLRKAGHACWLLALPDSEIDEFEPSIRDYLKEGIRQGVHRTPTAMSLRKWYSIPMPANPPDLFITYLFRGAPRFVMNSAGVLNLTNILGGRFKPEIADITLRSAILNLLNDQAHTWIDVIGAGRIYKGDLRKIEPRELSNLPLNDIFVKLLGNLRNTTGTIVDALFD